jgi:hypothetical protein
MTPQEAKERLRAAARRLTLEESTRRHPKEAILSAAILGFLVGNVPLTPGTLRQSLLVLLRMM